LFLFNHTGVGSTFEDEGESESGSAGEDTEIGEDIEEEPWKKQKRAELSSSAKRGNKAQRGEKAKSKPKKMQLDNNPDLDMHGLEAEFEEFVKQRAAKARAKKTANINDDESVVKFGGFIPEGQTDEIEAAALKVKLNPLVLPTKKSTVEYDCYYKDQN
jgi:hypothetical protein